MIETREQNRNKVGAERKVKWNELSVETGIGEKGSATRVSELGSNLRPLCRKVTPSVCSSASRHLPSGAHRPPSVLLLPPFCLWQFVLIIMMPKVGSE